MAITLGKRISACSGRLCVWWWGGGYVNEGGRRGQAAAHLRWFQHLMHTSKLHFRQLRMKVPLVIRAPQSLQW